MLFKGNFVCTQILHNAPFRPIALVTETKCYVRENRQAYPLTVNISARVVIYQIYLNPRGQNVRHIFHVQHMCRINMFNICQTKKH
jgi:hypothetical protein